jgi:hypothetical protein
MCDNVLDGVSRRAEPPAGMVGGPPPRNDVNVTFRVDGFALLCARGRALLEGTSVNGLVCRLLEDYSGVHPRPEDEVARRLPRLERPRVRMTENSYR